MSCLSFQLVEELRSLKEKSAYEKAVVVSQWTSMLEIVAVHLKSLSMNCAEINGEMMLNLYDYHRESKLMRKLFFLLSCSEFFVPPKIENGVYGYFYEIDAQNVSASSSS